MSFTVATILAFNGERGIAISGLGERIYFDKCSVPVDERRLMCEGATVIYTPGSIELATSSFINYQDAEREARTCETSITEPS